MIKKLTFPQAVDALSMLREMPFGLTPETEELERLVLDHQPNTAAEAGSILAEIAYNLEAGPRSDGRDIAALNLVSRWLYMIDETAFRSKGSLTSNGAVQNNTLGQISAAQASLKSAML